MPDEKLSNVQAIRKFFDNVSMNELKSLSKEDREELGELARIELSKNK